MEQPREQQQRQVAYITSIAEIERGHYIKQEGWQPSYVKSGNRELSRVNLIGVIVSTQEDAGLRTAMFDDSTGMIELIFFEKFENLMTGQLVNLIGRVREYNGKKAIMPEIIKKLSNQKWVQVRALELDEMRKDVKAEEYSASENVEGSEDLGSVEEEVIGEEEKMEPNEKSENKFEKACRIIKEADKGDGADFQTVIEQGAEEKIIQQLLTEGEIFEISPGKLKVLE